VSATQFLWAVIGFLSVAAIVFAAGGLVDAVAIITTALFLTYLLIVMLAARARQGES
jgi:hypothetical protein